VLVKSSLSTTKFKDGLQVCTNCKRALPRDSFWADKRVVRGTVPQCKECMGARYKGWAKKNPEVRKKTTREWFDRNKAKTKARNRKYYEANKERLAKHNKKYREENREAISERRCARYQQNREVIIAKVGAYTKRRRKEDPVFRARANLRTRLTEVLRGRRKVAKTMELVGCTLAELKAHLELLFAPGMSWDNYGQWHIDHIMPCAMFDLLDPAQQRECFHYTNLQPLWAKDNIRKSDRSPEEWARISEGVEK
jgi:hypothetical protein